MARKTVTNITDALACVRKLKQGKSCTMQELKSSLLLMEGAYKSVQRAKRESNSRIEFLERMLQTLR